MVPVVFSVLRKLSRQGGVISPLSQEVLGLSETPYCTSLALHLPPGLLLIVGPPFFDELFPSGTTSQNKPLLL